MEAKFEKFKKSVFAQTLKMFGVDAVWTPVNAEIVGRVFFKDPTQSRTIGDGDVYRIDPSLPTAEYFAGTFIGLKEAVERQSHEYLRIRNRIYLVTKVETKFDGDTYVAELELVI